MSGRVGRSPRSRGWRGARWEPEPKVSPERSLSITARAIGLIRTLPAVIGGWHRRLFLAGFIRRGRPRAGGVRAVRCAAERRTQPVAGAEGVAAGRAGRPGPATSRSSRSPSRALLPREPRFRQRNPRAAAPSRSSRPSGPKSPSHPVPFFAQSRPVLPSPSTPGASPSLRPFCAAVFPYIPLVTLCSLTLASPALSPPSLSSPCPPPPPECPLFRSTPESLSVPSIPGVLSVPLPCPQGHHDAGAEHAGSPRNPEERVYLVEGDVSPHQDE
ncbi:uncharacterized protein LOC118155226 [Callithrix jacchus]|uniref:uncharacterized protein LOC118155226 n=1 Tax=Callithrix jacchus TaxID=9483 RepID=UPI00159E4874|nr:uncharacterized protein LOC118155226 [Callithrix jacchus]